MSFSVAPGFLIAMPSLLDPNFYRSVVMLCSHDAEGAFGLVINLPLEIPVSAICEEAGIEWQGDDTPRAFNGGPVERQRGWILHDAGESFEGTQVIADEIGITTSQDGLEAFASKPDERYRLLLGYAGWGPLQLDQEIGMGAWLTAPLDPELVFAADPSSVWRLALASVGVDATHLVDGGHQVN